MHRTATDNEDGSNKNVSSILVEKHWVQIASAKTLRLEYPKHAHTDTFFLKQDYCDPHIFTSFPAAPQHSGSGTGCTVCLPLHDVCILS